MYKIAKYIFIAISIILFTSCNAPKSSSEKPKEKRAESTTRFYSIEKISSTADGCQSDKCSVVEVNYPKFNTNFQKSERTNRLIEENINAIIKNNLFETIKSNSTDQLIEAFFNGYRAFKTEFPESITPWSIKIDITPTYIGEKFTSLSFNTYSYTGGAHPSDVLTYLNISKDGKELTKYSQFFKDSKSLKAQVEKKFRIKFNLSEKDNLADRGFLFEKNKFELSENFGFTDDGLSVYYNPYEIAPHSQGAIIITIPFSELNGNFKF